MRRPVMYLAGLLLATGASFALAGPASAAVSHNPYDSGDEIDLRYLSYNLNHEDSRYTGASQTGIFLGSPMGNGGNILPILSGPFN